MPLDPLLIEMLACPEDKGPLLWFEDEDLLYNPRLQRGYKVRRRDPGHADRRVGRRRRRRARPADGQVRGRRGPGDRPPGRPVRGVTGPRHRGRPVGVAPRHRHALDVVGHGRPPRAAGRRPSAAARVVELPDGDRDAIAVLGGRHGRRRPCWPPAAADACPRRAGRGRQVLRARPPGSAPGTLVFAVSCSGDTEETLATAEAAFASGASVVVVAGGGQLTRMADERGAPRVAVPASIPQPRAAIGAMAVPAARPV